MKRLAMFTPVLPLRTGISDYTERLLPYLDQEWDVHLFLNGYSPSETSMAHFHKCFHRREFDLIQMNDPYDQIVYQIGNNNHHDYIYPTLFKYPGVVILHDGNLHRARARASFVLDHLEDYLAEIEYCHGPIGRIAGRLVASGMYSDLIYDQFPMLNFAVEGASGIIVHNQLCRDRVLKCNLQGSVSIVPAPCMDESRFDTDTARKQLGFDRSICLIAAFGFIAPGKGLESALAAFARLRHVNPAVRFLLVGEALDAEYLRHLMNEIDSETREFITTTGFVSSDMFQLFLSAVDICVNMRYPTQGEASSALLRVMAAGKPVLIPWYQQYMEIPRDACVHIDLFPDEITFVFEAFEALRENPQLRNSIGKKASQYAALHHSNALWSASLLDVLRNTHTHEMNIQPLIQRIDLPNIQPRSVIDQISASIGEYVEYIPDLEYQNFEQRLKECGLQ